MDYKIDNLKEKVYKGFIKGEYGDPKIPTENEVIKKIESFTDVTYSPLVEKERIPNFDYSEISGKFSKVIDDIDILFNSIEDESRDILDQLTASIKEHNGAKRELRRIRAKTNDIVTRRLGEEYLEYNFTESFDDIENINTIISDPIDTDAGVFTILGSSSNLLSLPHYRDRKLEFSVIESFSSIVEYGYVGDTNATSILDKDDPRSISYRIRTKSPTKLKVVLALQLLPDGKSTEINAVGINLDSSLTKGFIRLYYQKDFQWKDVPALSLQEIKSDTVIFSFPSIKATHIKFEFIKDYPDVTNTNEYFFTINEIAISKSTNKNEARLYSKPIIIEQYSTETPVIDNLSCVMDADVPDGCSAKVFVARDILISGQFTDASNIPVLSDSIEATTFDPLATGTVYLSDIMIREGISGLDPYREFDFNWNELKPGEAFGNSIPEIIELDNSAKRDIKINPLFNADWYTFGDSGYLGPWPQYPAYGTIFISGWCNSSNSQWVPYLSGAVSSGWFVSGIDVATALGISYNQIETSSGINPLILADSRYSGQWLGYGNGYPFNYYLEDLERTLKFGEYTSSINGWWRPVSVAIKPEGVDENYGSGSFVDHNQYGKSIPDFYLNGIKFYKVYKFGKNQNVVESSIRLYSYETRPIDSESDTYEHNFSWRYKSNWSIETGTSLDAKDSLHSSDANFSNYKLTLPVVNTNEEYIIDGVNELKLHNTNVMFTKNVDYIISPDTSGRPKELLLYPFDKNQPHLKPSGLSFDITFNYKVNNQYQSTWTSFAIVNPGIVGTVTIRNPRIFEGKKRIVDRVIIEDLDSGTSFERKDDDGKIIFELDAKKSITEKHFKVTIYCAADEKTGFSAKSGVGSTFIPSENSDRNFLKVSKGIKFVSRLDPIKIVDMSTLLYDTPMSNDKRCALITDYNNEKFLVAKIPSKDIFPGYYFNSIAGKYSIESTVLMKNTGHFIRQSIFGSGIGTYITGSSGLYILDPWNAIDSSWNDGRLLSTVVDRAGVYPNHSTYGFPITLDDSSTFYWNQQVSSGYFDLRAPNRDYALVGSPAWSGWIENSEYSGSFAFYKSRNFFNSNDYVPNRGYLFYDTAENLPAFYSIGYRTIKNTDSSYSRFLYKIELSSNGDRTVVPKIRSIRFIVNEAV